MYRRDGHYFDHEIEDFVQQSDEMIIQESILSDEAQELVSREFQEVKESSQQKQEIEEIIGYIQIEAFRLYRYL